MAIFKCKMCGGTLEISEGSTVAECEYCGTKQTLPRLTDEKKANLYDRANHFRRNNDYDKAMGIYEQILSEDNTDAEAYWSLVLCKYGIEYVEDPTTRKRIPTVNRAQYISVVADADYKSALEYAAADQKEVYEAEAKAIDEIQKGILEVSKKETPFDVFICYKETDNNGRRTPDSVLATELYHGLTNEGFKVFFSRITLEDKLGTAYEPYIFAALNSAKVMVVLGTKPEYFNAVWVKNEWSRYLTLIKKGEKKVLIPAYKDMDSYDLPEEFSHLQAQDMSKLGFMQDLKYGIKKILSADKTITSKEPSAKTNANINTSVESTIDYALLLIEDGEFEKAQQSLNKIVSIVPKHPMIYVGQLLIELGIKRQEDLGKLNESFEASANYQKAVRFADSRLKAALEGYADAVRSNKVKSVYMQAVSKMNKGVDFEDYITAKQLFDTIPHYADAKQLSILCADKANIAKKESVYQKALKLMNSDASDKIAELQKAIDEFSSVRQYKDSAVQIDNCERLIYAEKEAIAKKIKRKKKTILTILLLFAVMIVAVVGYFKVILPKSSYAKAEEQFTQANYSEAYEMYNKLGNYADSANKAKECLYILAITLRNEREWEKANALFEQIKGYKDSAELIHIHNYEEIASQEATCETAGYKDFRCNDCGETTHSNFEARGHSYSEASCSKPKKCETCGEISGSALGHTDDLVRCSRCGEITFKAIVYSGKGSDVKSNINLPGGKFKITCTMISGSSNMTMYFNHGSNKEDMVFNHYVAGTTEVTVVSGPISSGTLVINANNMWDGSKMGWKVSIEAIE